MSHNGSSRENRRTSDLKLISADGDEIKRGSSIGCVKYIPILLPLTSFITVQHPCVHGWPGLASVCPAMPVYGTVQYGTQSTLHCGRRHAGGFPVYSARTVRAQALSGSPLTVSRLLRESFRVHADASAPPSDKPTNHTSHFSETR